METHDIPHYKAELGRQRCRGAISSKTERYGIAKLERGHPREYLMSAIRRRDVFLLATTAGVAAALGGASSTAPAASAQLTARRDKRRPQYQPDSPEVQTFYRVNRYPAK